MEPSSVSRVGVEMSDPKPSFSFEPLLPFDDEEFHRHFPNYVGGLSQCKQNGLITFPEFAHHAEVFYRFQPRCDDVWVMTFPKSGQFCSKTIYSSQICKIIIIYNYFIVLYIKLVSKVLKNLWFDSIFFCLKCESDQFNYKLFYFIDQ